MAKTIITNLQTIQQLTSPLSLLLLNGQSYPNRIALQDATVQHIPTVHLYKKTTYLVDLSMICLLEGKFPSDELEILSLNGIGPKIGHVLLWEVYGRITVSTTHHNESFHSCHHVWFTVFCRSCREYQLIFTCAESLMHWNGQTAVPRMDSMLRRLINK